jgi:hypothetical protein
MPIPLSQKIVGEAILFLGLVIFLSNMIRNFDVKVSRKSVCPDHRGQKLEEGLNRRPAQLRWRRGEGSYELCYDRISKGDAVPAPPVGACQQRAAGNSI